MKFRHIFAPLSVVRAGRRGGGAFFFFQTAEEKWGLGTASMAIDCEKSDSMDGERREEKKSEERKAQL